MWRHGKIETRQEQTVIILKSEHRGFCGRCEEEYEPYIIFLCDDIECFKDWYLAKQVYGWICRDCLHEFVDSNAYAVEDSVLTEFK